ncbi:MAG: hypothetical protein M1814_003968 [Vezdaea aestivalis]|nr:MAG: hypothetical protein M1814_003968 [Vezdaea aestivalis]
MGQFGRILRDRPGAPMQEWINTIPNDGLIYYRGLFNSDRIMPTSPQALSEILNQKSYDFVKPAQVREGIGRLLGHGLLLVEGDEHKFQRKNLLPAFAFRHIKSLYPIFWDKGCEMIQAMTAEIQQAQSRHQTTTTSGIATEDSKANVHSPFQAQPDHNASGNATENSDKNVHSIEQAQFNYQPSESARGDSQPNVHHQAQPTHYPSEIARGTRQANVHSIERAQFNIPPPEIARGDSQSNAHQQAQSTYQPSENTRGESQPNVCSSMTADIQGAQASHYTSGSAPEGSKSNVHSTSTATIGPAQSGLYTSGNVPEERQSNVHSATAASIRQAQSNQYQTPGSVTGGRQSNVHSKTTAELERPQSCNQFSENATEESQLNVHSTMTASKTQAQSDHQSPGSVTEEGQANVHSTLIEVSQWTSRAALDIIGIAGLGIEFDSIKNPAAPLAVQYRNVLQPTAQAQILAVMSMVIPGFIIRNMPLQRNNDVWQAVKVIRATCHQAISEKTSVFEKTGHFPNNDILGIAMESGAFHGDALVDQLMTFLAAGHETTATSMIWVIYQLSKHPEIQRRLREEIRHNLPSPSSTHKVDDKMIDSLPYLHAVTQEILRHTPAVPMTVRTARIDSTILGYFIPKSTRVIIAAQAVNCSKALWGEDAYEFKPERWLGEGRSGNGGATSNYANLTFLHGPRSCIGQSFAKAEFKCLLAVLIGRLSVSLVDPNWIPEIKGGITAKPKGGLTVKATIIEGW